MHDYASVTSVLGVIVAVSCLAVLGAQAASVTLRRRKRDYTSSKSDGSTSNREEVKGGKKARVFLLPGVIVLATLGAVVYYSLQYQPHVDLGSLR